jgi:predicted phage terminase large subunit-like protein
MAPRAKSKKSAPKSGPLSAEELALWYELESLAGADSILDWVPLMSPTFQRPEHLTELAKALVRSQFEPVYATIAVPPRHSKTETICHSIPWRFLRDPTCEVAYCTYEANLAYSKSRRIREISEQIGVKLKRAAKGVQEWQTAEGGRMIATGVGGPLTGRGARLLIIDDPLKNREEAESTVIRQKIWDWFTSTALTRVEPGGSVIVCHTRWHDDDLIGRIKREFAGDDAGPKWTHISMPAVSEDRVESFSVNGEPVVETRRRALWPSRWNLAELDKKRRLVGEYDWSALYQGEPRPKGGRLFQAATRYQFANIVEGKEPCKIVIGADPAATEKTNADYSAIVVASFTGSWDKEDPSNTENLGFRGDILEVWRGQVTVPEFVKRLRDIAVKWGAPIAVEAVAGFKAVPQMLRQLDKTLKIIEAPAVGDKFTRSLPVSAAWNYGRVRIPDDVANNPWVHDFLAEIEKFTGVKDKHDDQVDALAHAYNAAQTLMPAVVKRTPVHRPSFLPFG